MSTSNPENRHDSMHTDTSNSSMEEDERSFASSSSLSNHLLETAATSQRDSVDNDLCGVNSTSELEDTLATIRREHADLQAAYDVLDKQANKAQEELADLKHVNISLMDENESYQLLLGERTLSGEILGQGFLGRNWETEALSPQPSLSPDLCKTAVPTIKEVFEEDEDDESARRASIPELQDHGAGSWQAGAVGAQVDKIRNNRSGKVKAPTVGLDLAAELDRAEESNSALHDEVSHFQQTTYIGGTSTMPLPNELERE